MFKLKNLKKSAKKSYEKTKESLINISSIFFCHVAKTYNITIQVIYSFIFLKRHYSFVVTLFEMATIFENQKEMSPSVGWLCYSRKATKGSFVIRENVF